MTPNKEEQILWKAEFNPKVRTYWLLSGALILFISVVGIPLLPFWFIFGHALTARYLKHMRCALTRKNLQVAKGMFVRTEKTVPLDKITDLALIQGPIMRHYNLHALSVETAGQSSEGALIKLVGVIDTVGFREAVLEQRDKMVEALREDTSVESLPSPSISASTEVLLTDIRDAVHRIEEQLSNRS